MKARSPLWRTCRECRNAECRMPELGKTVRFLCHCEETEGRPWARAFALPVADKAKAQRVQRSVGDEGRKTEDIHRVPQTEIRNSCKAQLCAAFGGKGNGLPRQCAHWLAMTSIIEGALRLAMTEEYRKWVSFRGSGATVVASLCAAGGR